MKPILYHYDGWVVEGPDNAPQFYWTGSGPVLVKIGGQVVDRLEIPPMKIKGQPVGVMTKRAQVESIIMDWLDEWIAAAEKEVERLRRRAIKAGQVEPQPPSTPSGTTPPAMPPTPPPA